MQALMRQDVQPDVIPGVIVPRVSARAGEVYDVQLNSQGAVCAIIEGELLGLKPDEFDFVCPLFEDGVTELVRGQWRVYPRSGAGMEYAALDLVDGEWRWGLVRL